MFESLLCDQYVGREDGQGSWAHDPATFDPSLIQVDLNGNPRPKTLYEIFENSGSSQR